MRRRKRQIRGVGDKAQERGVSLLVNSLLMSLIPLSRRARLSLSHNMHYYSIAVLFFSLLLHHSNTEEVKMICPHKHLLNVVL